MSLKKRLVKDRQNRSLIARHDVYFEDGVTSTLSMLIECMEPGKFEKKKAEMFFGFFLSTSGSASEKINSYLNKFFVKFPKDTRDIILEYPKRDASLLAKSLRFSWENNNYDMVNKKLSAKMPRDLSLLLQELGIKRQASNGSIKNEKRAQTISPKD